MSSLENINIRITDFDDQGPMFSQPSYSRGIKEDVAVVSYTAVYIGTVYKPFMCCNRDHQC